MSDAAAVVLPDSSFLQKLALGQQSSQTSGETQAMLGRGSMVFLSGMALAAASFFVEQAMVRAIRKL